MLQDGADRGGEAADLQRQGLWDRGRRRDGLRPRRRSPGAGALEAGIEGGDVHRHRVAALDDGLTIGVGREGERGSAGDRPEDHRADDGTLLGGEGRHVERHQALRALARLLQQLPGVGTAVARVRLLADGVGAVRRGDQRRAIRGDESALHAAHRFQQLGRHHHVDIARVGHQRHDGPATIRRKVLLGKNSR